MFDFLSQSDCWDLSLGDSFVGASSLTSATIDASISVDSVNIALRDSFNGAFTDTRAASYTLVGSNNTCHSLIKFSLEEKNSTNNK